MGFREVVIYLSFIAGGFLLGSIPFCRVLPKLIKHVDVCALSDDGNPGAANAFKHCGVLVGSLCLLCDMLKGFLPAFFAYLIVGVNSVFYSFVMIAPVLGHALGIFNDFAGGKCISTSFGVAAGTAFATWIGWILVGAYILTAGILRLEHRLASIITFGFFGVSSVIVGIIIGFPFVGIGFLLISITAIIKHLPKRKVEDTDDVSVPV